MNHPVKIAICASGEGSNFAAIVEASRRGELPAQIVGLIVNRAAIGAIDRAKQLKIPLRILAPKEFLNRELWDQALVQQLQAWRSDWVVLAGFLVQIGPHVLSQYQGRIVNSHPSLLPRYGGPGMYGEKVHSAVLDNNEHETGITVHLVDAKYDEGPIVAQHKVSILPGDTVAQLSARVKALENEFYPKVLADLVSGRWTTS